MAISTDSPLTPVTPGHVGLSLGHVVGLGVVHSMGTLPGEIRNLQPPAAINLAEDLLDSVVFKSVKSAKEWTLGQMLMQHCNQNYENHEVNLKHIYLKLLSSFDPHAAGSYSIHPIHEFISSKQRLN